jgi:imidazole glycerol-phosphate synthase subunit HisH
MAIPRVAIVDYGLGNLYSVKHACTHVGLDGVITSSKGDILASSAVILPGVGAFGDAMDNLRRLDLVEVLRDVAASPTPFLGVCLGLQLLMRESEEFGRHRGLGIVDGQVVRFPDPMEGPRKLKVPQIGWNRIEKSSPSTPAACDAWGGSLLDGIGDQEYMYFVHSFIVQPDDPHLVLSISHYGHVTFCSSLQRGSMFACQFHPERSGPAGLVVYRNLASRLGPVAKESLRDSTS